MNGRMALPDEGRLSPVAYYGKKFYTLTADQSWVEEAYNVSVLVAIGVNREGYGEILGVAEGAREDKGGWTSFLRYLRAKLYRSGSLHIRQVHGYRRELGGILPQHFITAVDRPFLPERIHHRAKGEDTGDCRHVHGHPYSGGQIKGTKKSADSDNKA